MNKKDDNDFRGLIRVCNKKEELEKRGCEEYELELTMREEFEKEFPDAEIEFSPISPTEFEVIIKETKVDIKVYNYIKKNEIEKQYWLSTQAFYDFLKDLSGIGCVIEDNYFDKQGDIIKLLEFFMEEPEKERKEYLQKKYPGIIFPKETISIRSYIYEHVDIKNNNGFVVGVKKRKIGYLSFSLCVAMYKSENCVSNIKFEPIFSELWEHQAYGAGDLLSPVCYFYKGIKI